MFNILPTRGKSFKWLQAILLSLLIGLGPITVSAEDINKRYFFDVKSQEISQTLNDVAKQTGYQLLFSYELVGSLKNQRVKGYYSLIQLLDTLLQDTNLAAKVSDRGVIVITPASPNKNREEEKVKSKKSLLALMVGFLSGAGVAQIANAQESEPKSQYALEEVVVTATKRAVSEQDISLSIETVSGEELVQSGVTDFEDLAEEIPNFFIADGVVSTSVAIRGFASGTERSFEQSVSMFIDGVHMPRSRQYRSPFFDAERVEVIRGPQAALYGQNSTAGAISVVSAKTMPDDETTVEISAGYEMAQGGYNIAGVAGTSLGDTLGARLAVQYNDSEGYIDNTFDDSENGGTEELLVRGTLVWEPSDETSFTLKYDHAKFDVNGLLGELYGNPIFGDGENTLNYQTNYDAAILDALGIEDGLFQTIDNVALVAETEVGDHTLTFTGGYSDYAYDFGIEIDFSPVTVLDAYLREEYTQWNGELRLASPVGQTFEYIIGAYAANGELFNDQPTYANLGVLAGPTLAGVFEEASTISALDSETLALFAIGTINVSDNVRVIAGVRYNSEKKSLERSSYCNLFTLAGADLGPGFALCPALPSASRSRSSDNLLPEATLEFDIGDNTLIYAKVAQSAKSGGFAFGSSVASEEFLEYDDEKATNYEAGIKSTFWDNRALLNVSVFNTSFEDLQLNSFTADPDNPGQRVTTTTNAGEARSRGLEAEFNLAVNEWITLSASVSIIDAEFTDYAAAPCYVGDLNVNSDGESCDHTGLAPPYAADIQSNLGIDFDKPISDSLDFIGGVNMTTSSSYLTDGTLDPAGTQGSYEKLNARIGVRDSNDRWDLLLIGRNLSDEQVLNVTQPSVFGGYLGYSGRPRTVTLQGRMRF